MTDLVARLRACDCGIHCKSGCIQEKAADEIERQCKRIDQLIEISAVEMSKRDDEIERLRGELHSVHAHLNYLRSLIDRLRKVRDIADLLVNECEGGRKPPSLGILAQLESALAMEHKARSE